MHGLRAPLLPDPPTLVAATPGSLRGGGGSSLPDPIAWLRSGASDAQSPFSKKCVPDLGVGGCYKPLARLTTPVPADSDSIIVVPPPAAQVAEEGRATPDAEQGAVQDSKEERRRWRSASKSLAWLGRSSEMATVLVILKAFVGGTMLVLPGSLSQTGIVSGNLTLWTVGLLELWCMLKLVDAHQRFGGSFGQLAARAMGPRGAWAVEASILLSQLGFTAAEMIYVAKTGAFAVQWVAMRVPALGNAGLTQEEVEPILIWLQLLVAIPVSWCRDLGALTFFNFAGNALILGAVGVLSVVTAEGLAERGSAGDLKLSAPLEQVLIFTGFSVYAFEGITMVIPIYAAHRNKETFNAILVWTIVGITALFSLFATANVALYGDYVQPVLTLNLPKGSSLQVWVSVAFALGSLTLVFLMAFPTYEILEGCLRRSLGVRLGSPTGVNALRSLVVFACALVARFGGQRLDLFLSLVGAVGCVPLAFIYPAAIHMRLVAESRAEVVGDVGVMIMGLGITTFCLAGVL